MQGGCILNWSPRARTEPWISLYNCCLLNTTVHKSFWSQQKIMIRLSQFTCLCSKNNWLLTHFIAGWWSMDCFPIMRPRRRLNESRKECINWSKAHQWSPLPLHRFPMVPHRQGHLCQMARGKGLAHQRARRGWTIILIVIVMMTSFKTG